MNDNDHEPGTRFLVIEIPADASDDDADALMEAVAETAYDYEPSGENKAWDPFIYGWQFPSGQAVERPHRKKENTDA